MLLYLIGVPSIYEAKLYTDNDGEEYQVGYFYSSNRHIINLPFIRNCGNLWFSMGGLTTLIVRAAGMRCWSGNGSGNGSGHKNGSMISIIDKKRRAHGRNVNGAFPSLQNVRASLVQFGLTSWPIGPIPTIPYSSYM
jgi:hypothetical protein